MASENSRFLYASSWVQRLLYGKSIPARFLPFLTVNLASYLPVLLAYCRISAVFNG